MKHYLKNDHGINLTQTGVVNLLRCSLKIECCRNLKKCKGGLTFVEVLQETTVLVCFENYEVDLKILRNQQSLYCIYFRVERERNFLTFSGILKTCWNSGLRLFNRCSI